MTTSIDVTDDDAKIGFVRDLLLRGWKKGAIKRAFRQRFGSMTAGQIEPFISRARDQLDCPTPEIEAEARAVAAWYSRLMMVVAEAAEHRFNAHRQVILQHFPGREMFPRPNAKRPPWPVDAVQEEILELVERAMYVVKGRPNAEKPSFKGGSGGVQHVSEPLRDYLEQRATSRSTS